jgi:hypothetical protein
MDFLALKLNFLVKKEQDGRKQNIDRVIAQVQMGLKGIGGERGIRRAVSQRGNIGGADDINGKEKVWRGSWVKRNDTFHFSIVQLIRY